jgi:plasmid stabilization system protein ParE
MLREIVWSRRAIQENLEILEYWINRNKSYTYSTKLDSLLKENINLIASIPEIGKPTDSPSVRVKIGREYLIYYRIKPDSIEILSIWDSRRNPQKFKL